MPVYHRPPPSLTGREDTEDGPEAMRVFHHIRPEGTRALIGFACEAGVHRNKGRPGASQAPEAIRNALAGLAAPAALPAIADLGDIVVEGDDLEQGQELLAAHVAGALNDHQRVIVLGGGHETAYASYLGLRRRFAQGRIGIINLDAHLDIRNSGPAGPSSGTPFNQIRNLDPAGFDYLCIGVAREANTQALFTRADTWGVQIIYDQDLLTNPRAADQYIHDMAKRCDYIYLTIDIDLLPHFQAPGVSAPAARGVPLAIVEQIIRQVQQACDNNECAMPLADIVEVSPPHDRDGMTIKTAAVIALSLL